jgi:hypothetical protein
MSPILRKPDKPQPQQTLSEYDSSQEKILAINSLDELKNILSTAHIPWQLWGSEGYGGKDINRLWKEIRTKETWLIKLPDGKLVRRVIPLNVEVTYTDESGKKFVLEELAQGLLVGDIPDGLLEGNLPVISSGEVMAGLKFDRSTINPNRIITDLAEKITKEELSAARIFSPDPDKISKSLSEDPSWLAAAANRAAQEELTYFGPNGIQNVQRLDKITYISFSSESRDGVSYSGLSAQYLTIKVSVQMPNEFHRPNQTLVEGLAPLAYFELKPQPNGSLRINAFHWVEASEASTR